jgi:hypothetical protein
MAKDDVTASTVPITTEAIERFMNYPDKLVYKEGVNL